MKRLENQSMKDYKKTRKEFNRGNKKTISRGFLVWNSVEKGTYIRAKHGKLKFDK